MYKQHIKMLCLLFAVGLIMLLVYTTFFWERTKILDCNSESIQIEPIQFEFEEVDTIFYDKFLNVYGEPLSEVRWEYLPGTDYLKKFGELYGFQYNETLGFGSHSYIASVGCRIIECWSEETISDSMVLNVTYDDKYQGKKIFIYEFEKISIYPLKWPSYIMKNEQKMQFATNPDDYDKSLLSGYVAK